LSSTLGFTEEQLAAARSTKWHQAGDPLLTLEAARNWVNECGLVLFAPRTAQLPAPAPSLVEATLGAANAAPTLAETEIARGLVARLVGEGLALPLNLMAVPGDSPDFVVSAQVFSYIFTLRGDKVWKLPPSTSGAVKVSPLGLRVFEVLTERGPMTAPELAAELGREVTEAAILRSLSELWSQLRVIPLVTQGSGSTLWELTTRRFTKAIKAGANAGVPTALSALISLYLGQVLTATEEEITTFLSPLTARSRVREVVHALLGARQLETVAVEGKTLLHLPGATLGIAAETVEDVDGLEAVAAPVIERPKKVGTGRISSFTSERKPAAEFRGKSVRSAAPRAGSKPTGRTFGKPPARPVSKFGASKFAGERKPESERRPFKKDGAAPARKSFTKPWDEDRKPLPAAAAAPDAFTKFRKPAPEDREPLGQREQAGLPAEKRSYPKASFGGRPKPSFGAKNDERNGREGKTQSTQWKGAEGSGFAAKPKTGFSKPGFGKSGFDRGAKPVGFAKKPYSPRTTEGGASGFTKKPYAARGAEDGAVPRFAKTPYAAKTPYTARKTEGSSGFAKPAFAKRPYTPRKAAEDGGESSFPKRTYTRKAEGAAPSSGAGWPKRPYTPRPAASRSAEETTGERRLPKRPYKPRAADADSRPFTKAPWTPSEDAAAKPKRAFKPRAEGSFGRGKPAGKFAGKPAGKFGGKPAGKFGGKPKPFGSKPAGARRPKSGE
jgi:23S rRNA pseudouridine2605 synthase